MASRCAGRGLSLVLEKISSLKGLSSTGTGCLVVQSPFLEVLKRHVDVALRDTV